MAGSAYDTNSSPYTFREDDAAEAERQNRLDVATVGAVSKVLGSPGSAGRQAPTAGVGLPQEGPTPEQMGVQASPKPRQSLAQGVKGAMDATAGEAAPPPAEGIQDFANFISQGSPVEAALRDRAARENARLLENPAEAFDLGAAAARENLDISQRNAREQRRNELVQRYGGNADQVEAGLQELDEAAKLERRGLNRDLTVGRADATRQSLAQGIASALGISQLGSQERLARESLAAQRQEGAAGRASAEKIALLQIGSAERLQDAQNRFSAAERERDRVLERESQALGINAQMALQRNQMDFDAVMADKGYLNAKDLETLKAGFAQELQRQGYSDQAALQAADHQARALEAEADRRFNAAQAEISRRFTTSERIGAETFAKSIQGIEAQQEERMARLTSALGLEAEEKRFAYQQALQAGQNAWASGEAAADRAFQSKLKELGFTQEQALLATRLQHEALQADKQLAQQYTMFLAEQAQEDGQFAQQLGLEREKIQAAKEQWTQEFEKVMLPQLGIAQEQWAETKKNAQFDRELDLAMTGIEMWDGEDVDSIRPFIERLAKTMGGALGVPPEQLEAAIQKNFAPASNPTGEPKNTASAHRAFEEILEKTAGFVSDEARTRTLTLAKDLTNQAAGFQEGAVNKLPYAYNGLYSTAVTRLKSKGVDGDPLKAIVTRKDTNNLTGAKFRYTASPEFADYAVYVSLLNSGISKEEDAQAALRALVGADRAAAALALEGGEA